MLLHQLKTWMYWKAKVRLLHLWSNFKLFQVDNPYIIPLISMIGPLIGIVLMFVFGFGVAYLYHMFISDSSYHLWQFIFLLALWESVTRGLQNGRWISSTDEERWLLACTPFTTIKYLLFLWFDEEVWQNKSKFLSSLAGLMGIYIVFPVNVLYLFIGLIMLNALTMAIAFMVTLIQYYIIRKSVFLKGRGIVHNILLPLVSVGIILLLVKLFTPWMMTFPVGIDGHFVTSYLGWLSSITIPLGALFEQLISFVDHPWLPHSLFAQYLLNGDNMIFVYFPIYVGVLVFLSVLLCVMIARKDHVIEGKTSLLDKCLLNAFVHMDRIIFAKKSIVRHVHVKYMLVSLFQNYLTKRHLFVIFGERLWVYAVLYVGFIYYLPDQWRAHFILPVVFLIVVTYPIYFLWGVYTKLRIRLAFDSEGSALQMLMAYNGSPQYMYMLKTRVLSLVAFPGYFLVSLLTLILLPVPWYLVIIAMLLSVLVFVIVSRFVLLSSFLVPHYEFFNKQQIGEYPDQRQMMRMIRSFSMLLLSPVLPMLMYITGEIDVSEFVMTSISWILIGLAFMYVLLLKVYRTRTKSFDVEEISIGRARHVDASFWKRKGLLIAVSIVVHLATIFFGLSGEFLIAGIVYIVPSIVINVSLITSFRRKLASSI
ncbi:hypothetical protein [Shouchella lonarensis]|uniref:ABC-2 type transport system permease protein n=1 Tax=Shouchella lonarensis TaxID=1464122 RepID=A0A1G6GUZ1_9BACI|nr:hypothetical protein [Shouchella lonarensis]SDB85515.1 hypothetical protein SAMN05421737_10224 [Shouchella lonarensis]